MIRCINMYENKYKNEPLTRLEDLDILLNLLADLNEPLELFAIGGTAMVLKRIKESTKDIDFLTAEKYEKIKKLFTLAGLKEESSNKLCNIWKLGNIRIDIFYDGFIMGIRFPDDWRKLSEKVKEIGKIKLYILNWYDLIITKISRAEKRDIEDIIAIIKSQKLDFGFLKKRYYSFAETALISDFDYKFKHLEREYAKRKID
ncbi:nucleotidyltransferase [Candidatus Pacearchaeota archaeon]|nr:nucleotidyltransferase [Candidatus Pacearchaeota archaeon]